LILFTRGKAYEKILGWAKIPRSFCAQLSDDELLLKGFF